jgi:hypothetical protein
MKPATHEQIEQLAYQIWKERGCPEGAAEENWKQAEEILASPQKRNMSMRVSAAANVDEATGSSRH